MIWDFWPLLIAALVAGLWRAWDRTDYRYRPLVIALAANLVAVAVVVYFVAR